MITQFILMKTPLHIAAEYNNDQVIMKLLELNANIASQTTSLNQVFKIFFCFIFTHANLKLLTHI